MLLLVSRCIRVRALINRRSLKIVLLVLHLVTMRLMRRRLRVRRHRGLPPRGLCVTHLLRLLRLLILLLGWIRRGLLLLVRRLLLQMLRLTLVLWVLARLARSTVLCGFLEVDEGVGVVLGAGGEERDEDSVLMNVAGVPI